MITRLITTGWAFFKKPINTASCLVGITGSFAIFMLKEIESKQQFYKSYLDANNALILSRNMSHPLHMMSAPKYHEYQTQINALSLLKLALIALAIGISTRQLLIYLINQDKRIVGLNKLADELSLAKQLWEDYCKNNPQSGRTPADFLPTGEEQEQLICPITKCIMLDPIKANDNQYYDRSALQIWYDDAIRAGRVPTSPLTRQPLTINPKDLNTNKEMKNRIVEYFIQNRNQLKQELIIRQAP